MCLYQMKSLRSLVLSVVTAPVKYYAHIVEEAQKLSGHSSLREYQMDLFGYATGHPVVTGVPATTPVEKLWQEYERVQGEQERLYNQPNQNSTHTTEVFTACLKRLRPISDTALELAHEELDSLIQEESSTPSVTHTDDGGAG